MRSRCTAGNPRAMEPCDCDRCEGIELDAAERELDDGPTDAECNAAADRWLASRTETREPTKAHAAPEPTRRSFWDDDGHDWS